MTLFAVSCAGIFPLLHLGRPWLFYYLFPYPNTMAIWPQFRSPLIWDMFAVMTYVTVSIVFFFVGCCPISPRCAITRRIAGSASSTASSR